MVTSLERCLTAEDRERQDGQALDNTVSYFTKIPTSSCSLNPIISAHLLVPEVPPLPTPSLQDNIDF